MHPHILQTDKRNSSTTSPASPLSTLLVMNGSLGLTPWPLPTGFSRGRTQASLKPRQGQSLIAHLLQTGRCLSTPAPSTAGDDSLEITLTT